MKDEAAILQRIRLALDEGGQRPARIRRIADIIREAGGYRWVGIYEVAGEEIAAIAWSGPAEPAYPRFPATRGLCGEAVRRGETVVVADVTKDPRYLTTFGSTRSEIVVPVLDPRSRRAVGTVDVESERVNAFSGEDRAFLERCAAELGRHL
jgi:L-methionine (R)-S-oxide reductase